MTNSPDLTPGRDEALGALLRTHLSAPDDAAFAARMRNAAIVVAEDVAWKSVARWTLPGLAAAAVLLAVLGAAFGNLATQSGSPASDSAAESLVELASDSTPAGSMTLLAAMTY
jgi:hypothetical protein